MATGPWSCREGEREFTRLSSEGAISAGHSCYLEKILGGFAPLSFLWLPYLLMDYPYYSGVSDPLSVINNKLYGLQFCRGTPDGQIHCYVIK
ncbi:hypothetical protein B7P43_G04883 [Cryptotermes secundus]|uniref:Uncharacterized protein n=1 Tax=Cryptotermes secundus TaxID=105785 RepID=A0A2J7QV40_9NEOP|nr:hypothetical protein B7P43_G04883 [Cryptotermes secundus]